MPAPNGADVEVALGYQVIGGMVAAMAPKAHLTIVSYNAPNSERGLHRRGGDSGERCDPPPRGGVRSAGALPRTRMSQKQGMADLRQR
jgi:hypothetical protein